MRRDESVKIWQVQLFGAGFMRGGSVASFDLSGIVSAPSANEAFHAAVALARRDHQELEQARQPVRGPGAVINGEEIVELTYAPEWDIGVIELTWRTDGNA